MFVLVAVSAAVVRFHDAAGGAEYSDDVHADVLRPASDEPDPGTSGPDSIAGSSIEAENRTHIPYEDKLGDVSNVLGWLRRVGRKYPGLVPWEVVLPRGPPERFVISLSGTFIEAGPTFAEFTTLPTNRTDHCSQRHPLRRKRAHPK